jgi:hypothetical protein
MKRFLLIGAAIGLVLPVGFLAAHFLGILGSKTLALMLVLWPSSTILIAMSSPTFTVDTLLVFGVSLLLNILLYSLLSLIVYACVRLWKWCIICFRRPCRGE